MPSSFKGQHSGIERLEKTYIAAFPCLYSKTSLSTVALAGKKLLNNPSILARRLLRDRLWNAHCKRYHQ
jgi:hypothetical protein